MNSKNSRKFSNVSLRLKEEEPFPRLKEFCKIGNYRYSIYWDAFKNGRMMTCELFYFVNGRKRIIHRETQFVEGIFDEKYFRNVISQSLLHNIGLSGITHTEYDDTPTPEEMNLNTQMVGTVTKILGRTLQTLDEELSSQTSGGSSLSGGAGLGELIKTLSEDLRK
jgi:hypothetical protein